MTQQKPTRESVFRVWKKLDAKNDRAVGYKEVAKAMGIKPYLIEQLFAGESLSELKHQHVTSREAPQ
jgi:hypothetical protein